MKRDKQREVFIKLIDMQMAQHNLTYEDIKNDPNFYAELVNDLMFHWVYGTQETKLMLSAKESLLIGQGNLNK